MKCREEAAAAIGCGIDTLDPWCMNWFLCQAGASVQRFAMVCKRNV